MANWAVTYTFVNGTAADATQVNTNFTDLINASSDGTKDMSISALTLAGTLTANGSVNLGNASADDLVITASLASHITPKTTFTYDLGSSTVGFRSLYLGSDDAAARTVRLLGATIGSSWTFTFPTGVPGGAGYVLESTTGGVTSWKSRTDMSVVSKTTTYTATRADDVILCSDAGGSFTVTLPAASASMKRFIFKKTNSSSNFVTIARAGSDTIDGATAVYLYGQYETIEMVSDGTSAWNVVQRNFYSDNFVSANGTTAFTTSDANLISISVPPGIWLIDAFSYFGGNSTARIMRCGFSTTSGSTAAATVALNSLKFALYDTVNGLGTIYGHNFRAVVTTTTTYYWVGYVTSTSGAGTPAHYMQAVRIG